MTELWVERAIIAYVPTIVTTLAHELYGRVGTGIAQAIPLARAHPLLFACALCVFTSMAIPVLAFAFVVTCRYFTFIITSVCLFHTSSHC